MRLNYNQLTPAAAPSRRGSNRLCESVPLTRLCIRNRVDSRVVLALYRTREWTGCPREHGGIASVRYSDLKEAAQGCGGRGS